MSTRKERDLGALDCPGDTATHGTTGVAGEFCELIATWLERIVFWLSLCMAVAAFVHVALALLGSDGVGAQ